MTVGQISMLTGYFVLSYPLAYLFLCWKFPAGRYIPPGQELGPELQRLSSQMRAFCLVVAPVALPVMLLAEAMVWLGRFVGWALLTVDREVFQ